MMNKRNIAISPYVLSQTTNSSKHKSYFEISVLTLRYQELPVISYKFDIVIGSPIKFIKFAESHFLKEHKKDRNKKERLKYKQTNLILKIYVSFSVQSGTRSVN